MFNTGVTKVQPIEISPDNDDDNVTTVTSVSRVSSARSVVSSVSSMWAGSEQDEGEYDAFIRARKVNLYGQVTDYFDNVWMNPINVNKTLYNHFFYFI